MPEEAEASEEAEAQELMGPRTELACPFSDKAEAKALGAKWDPVAKVWYVPPGVSTVPFQRWLPGGAAGGAAASAAQQQL